MKIAQSPTREKFPLSTRKIIKKTIMGSIGINLLLGVVWFTVALIYFSIDTSSNLTTYSLFVVPVLMIIVSVLVYLYQSWYFAVYYYDLSADYIQIKKGPITPREITIPYERIQDVYVDQDILDRIFAIYDVHLSSATITSGMEAHIDGVEKESADGLREMLLKTIRERISKAKFGNSTMT
jgi:membrane protein YdbS with pleckstrin-like domain